MKKTGYLVTGLVLAILCALCFGALLRTELKPVSEMERTVQEALEEAYQPSAEPGEEAGEAVSEEAPETPKEPYVSPVDFAALQEVNPEIYAWLYIPGTKISYPLVQHDGDDSYYLTHDSEGNVSGEGAIFTEQAYNDTEFTDPVTVAYGHHMKSGTMFGRLQSVYSEPAGMLEHSELVVYLPKRELHYTIFAALPYDNRHILYTYDFGSRQSYEAFFNSVYSVRELGAVFREEAAASADDKLLILSTCLRGNSQRRYLVLAKWTDTIS